MAKSKTKNVIIAIIAIAVLAFIVMQIVPSNSVTHVIYTDNAELGVVKITLSTHNPFNLKTLFLAFSKTTAYAGEQVYLRDGVTNLNPPTCALNFWRFYITRQADGHEIYLGDFASDAYNFDPTNGCNLDVEVSFATNELGTYSGSTSYQWSGSSTTRSTATSNSMTVIENPGVECIWEETIHTISGGYYRLREHKDTNLANGDQCTQPDEVTTFCFEDYGIDGTSTRSASGYHTCEILTTTTCTSLGGDICSASETCGGTWLSSSDSTRCCSITCNGGGTCTNGATQACTIGTCAGTQTCSSSTWGGCIKTDPNCDSGVGNGKTITLTEFYSMSDEDFIDKAYSCGQSSECSALEGYDVSCVTSGSDYNKMIKRVYSYSKSQCEFAGLIKIIDGFQRFISGVSICDIYASTSVTLEGFVNSLVGTPGFCVAKANTWYGKAWEQILTLVASLGIPASFVLIAAVVIIIIIVMVFINILTK